VTPTTLVLRALLWLGALLLLSLLLLFGHGVWLLAFRRWSAPRVARGRALLYTVVDGPPGRGEDLALLRSLPLRLQVRLVVELASSIAGPQKEYLVGLADEIGLVRAAERLCRSRLWWRRLRGIRLLTVLGGGGAIVPALLDDRHPLVRAEAAVWAAAHPDPGVIGRLLRLLPDPASLCRFSVRDSLLRMGPAASAALLHYLEANSGPVLVPALEVAAGLADPSFFPVAVRLCDAPEPGVRRGAAELVGAIGGSEAIDTLTGLLRDPDAGVRAAAAAALGKLGHWPAAGTLAGLLRDPAWAVRREAGLALRALGSPGQLFLRRALADEDRFAADMARQVLDLPGATREAP